MANDRPSVQVSLEEGGPDEGVSREGVHVAAGLGEATEGGYVQVGEEVEVNANLCVCKYTCVCLIRWKKFA